MHAVYFLTRVPCKIIPTYDDGGNKLHALWINKHDWLTDARCARRHSYTLAGGNSGGAAFSPSFSTMVPAPRDIFQSAPERFLRSTSDERAGGRARTPLLIIFPISPMLKHIGESYDKERARLAAEWHPPFSVGTGDQFRLLIIVAERYGKFTRFFMHRKWISHRTAGW